MRSYDYNQMMQDYQFLTQVGRVVSSTGRDLADARMLQEPSKQGGNARRIPAAQHRREQLVKQIGYLRLPIMLLPDGMSKRQQNKTYFDTKKRLVLYTVQCAFPCTESVVEPVSVHAQSGIAEIGACIATALGARDAMSEPEAKRPRLSMPGNIEALGLQREDSQRLAPLADRILLLRIYPLRLRNETTTRFLDWWARKGSALHGETGPARPPRHEPLVSQHVLDKVARLHGTELPSADEALSWSNMALYVPVPNAMSIENVLRSLPADYGVVEFLELEVWSKEVIAAAERRGRAQVLELLPVPREGPAPRKDGGAHLSGAPEGSSVASSSTPQQSSSSVQVEPAPDAVATADNDPGFPESSSDADSSDASSIPECPESDSNVSTGVHHTDVPPSAAQPTTSGHGTDKPPTPLSSAAATSKPAPAVSGSTLVTYASSESESE